MSAFSVSPEVVWGLIPRIVGVLYLLAFGALAPQIQQSLGSRGIEPIGDRLQCIRRDFPGLRRFFEYPTVLWAAHSDLALSAIPWLGVLAGLCAIYGGPIGYAGLFLGWVLWLSLEPAGLIFPWDTLLQEAGFLALFLPLTHPLPELTAVHAPLPVVAFMFRWLVLRLMMGFGKTKFWGSSKEDSLYLRGFFVWMPMPSPLGWYAQHGPRWFLKASLVFMFFGEVVAPVLGLFSGPARLVSFLLLVGLMVGIQATGNWGYFNVGYALLCVCLLDLQSSIFDTTFAQLTESPGNVAIHATMAVMFLLSLVYLTLNSWATRTWVNWSFDDITWNRAWLRALVRVFRALAPFRIVSGYGVFPPKSSPPLRLLPVFEGSHDGEHWQPYVYKHLPTLPTSRPPVVAPYHPRFDQALMYAALAVHDGSFYSSVIGDGNPYAAYCRSSWMDRVIQRLLRDEPVVTRMFGHNPFAGVPPKWIRVSGLAMTPTSLAELRETGRWWRTRRLGTLVRPVGKESWPYELINPEPEVFHPDFVDHKRRSLPLRRIERAFARGMSADQAILEGSDLTSEQVARFWDELVPMLGVSRADWTRLNARAEALEARFSVQEIARFERILERYVWLLRMRTERHYFADATPKIALESNFRYHLLLQEIVLDGREAFQATLETPALASERARRCTHASMLWGLALLRYEAMMLHICAFRWSEMGLRGHEGKMPGLFEFYPFLVQHVPPGEEYCPKPVRHPDGEHAIPGLIPDVSMPPAGGTTSTP